MKLSWSTKNSRRWEADFGNGYLTLAIDYDLDKYGIYDPFCGGAPVWEENDLTTDAWEDLAEIAELELSNRLILVADTLDPSCLEAKQKCCDVCHLTRELHPGYYEGDQRRCFSCLSDFKCKVTAEDSLYPIGPKLEHGGDYSGLAAIMSETGKLTDMPSFKIEPVEAADFEVAKAADNLVNHYYTHFVESKVYRFYEDAPSTQVEDAIKAEAAGVKL